MPQASVNIAIPNGSGGLQQAFGISGAARFHFGGPDGFQLEDIRVSGFSIFGVNMAVVPLFRRMKRPAIQVAIIIAAVLIGAFVGTVLGLP